MPDHVHFEWPVDSAGYALEHEKGDGRTLLSTYEWDIINGRGGPPRFYRPMEEYPGLWRQFAETCVSNESVLGFIKDFGQLSDAPTLVDRALKAATFLRFVITELEAGNRAEAVKLFNENTNQRLTAKIRMNEDTKDFELKFIPLSLYTAIFQQTGEAITGNRQFRQCKNCATWFPLGPGPGAHTARRQFCSDRCRVAWSRRHKMGDKIHA